MSIGLRYQFWKNRRQTSPASAFKKQLWQKLENEIESKMSAPFFWLGIRRFKWIAAGLASLVVFLTIGTGVFAFGSPKVTEGTPLYFVKRAVERVQSQTAASPQAKAEFIIKTIKRRQAEGNELTTKGRNTKKVIDEISNLKKNLLQTKQQLSKQEQKNEGNNNGANRRVQKQEQKNRQIKERIDRLVRELDNQN